MGTKSSAYPLGVATFNSNVSEKSGCIGEAYVSVYNRNMVIPREVPRYIRGDPVETTRRRRKTTKAYLLGLVHDGTERKSTYRIATNNQEFAQFIKQGIKTLKVGSWIYQEGKDRNLWIVEFPKKILEDVAIRSHEDKIDYIRGYFDAEGGIAKHTSVRYYLYFCQKNKRDLLQVKTYLEELGIICGAIHNPSQSVDPNYWRFYISAKSYNDFATHIGSDHPEKRRYIRMKI